MNVYILSVSFALVFLLIVLDLVRRQKLKEQYGLLWILFGIIQLILSSNAKIMEYIANILGIKYAPAMLFLFGLLFCFSLILHLTIIISKLNDRLLRVTQELAILKSERQKASSADA